MYCTSFLKGMGVGLAVGTTVGSMMPKKRCKKHLCHRRSAAAKALRTVTDVMNELSDAMGQ